MKRVMLPLLLLLFFLTMLTQAQTGGNYDLTWNTYDGGGGFSVGGAFSLKGTIGQPDSIVMSGGSYNLSGGFWPGITDTAYKPEGAYWFLY